MQLEVRGLNIRYGGAVALSDFSLELSHGEAMGVIGANGAGKTTLLRAISGLVPVAGGTIVYEDQPIHNLPSRKIARIGIAHVPEGRRVLAGLSVFENLMLGAYTRNDKPAIRDDLEKVFEYFPILNDRKGQAGGTLSGGEQQMLAIGRALMMRPRLLLLDEPSLGIAPKIVSQIYQNLKRIVANEKVSIILVEQNARMAFSLVQRGYVLAQGRRVLSGYVNELENDPDVAKAYLGAH